MGKRNGICPYCNNITRLTTHHVKNRLGDRETCYDSRGRIQFIQFWVCRKCHDIIENDYILTGRIKQTLI